MLNCCIDRIREIFCYDLYVISQLDIQVYNAVVMESFVSWKKEFKTGVAKNTHL